jgi:hypothetical protein
MPDPKISLGIHNTANGKIYLGTDTFQLNMGPGDFVHDDLAIFTTTTIVVSLQLSMTIGSLILYLQGHCWPGEVQFTCTNVLQVSQLLLMRHL